jgi:predicted nucleic acid-binding protein
LSFNSNVADVASEIAKKLKAKNKIIEFRDIFIAATAIANDIPLSTFNVKHFERIDDLELR